MHGQWFLLVTTLCRLIESIAGAPQPVCTAMLIQSSSRLFCGNIPNRLVFESNAAAVLFQAFALYIAHLLLERQSDIRFRM
jgi:hypothetical protein